MVDQIQKSIYGYMNGVQRYNIPNYNQHLRSHSHHIGMGLVRTSHDLSNMRGRAIEV